MAADLLRREGECALARLALLSESMRAGGAERQPGGVEVPAAVDRDLDAAQGRGASAAEGADSACHGDRGRCRGVAGQGARGDPAIEEEEEEEEEVAALGKLGPGDARAEQDGEKGGGGRKGANGGRAQLASVSEPA